LKKVYFSICKLNVLEQKDDCPFFAPLSWTIDTPYRETPTAIEIMRRQNITCVEMEAAALYALAECKEYKIICFANLTNSMAKTEGYFEKGKEFGSIDTLNLITCVLTKFKNNREINL